MNPSETCSAWLTFEALTVYIFGSGFACRCEERITRIQKMDVLEGIFICGAPGCLRSFLARPDFDLHISDAHSQLLQLEQGKLSPGRNVSSSNTVSEPQVTIYQITCLCHLNLAY